MSSRGTVQQNFVPFSACKEKRQPQRCGFSDTIPHVQAVPSAYERTLGVRDCPGFFMKGGAGTLGMSKGAPDSVLGFDAKRKKLGDTNGSPDKRDLGAVNTGWMAQMNGFGIALGSQTDPSKFRKSHASLIGGSLQEIAVTEGNEEVGEETVQALLQNCFEVPEQSHRGTHSEYPNVAFALASAPASMEPASIGHEAGSVLRKFLGSEHMVRTGGVIEGPRSNESFLQQPNSHGDWEKLLTSMEEHDHHLGTEARIAARSSFEAFQSSLTMDSHNKSYDGVSSHTAPKESPLMGRVVPPTSHGLNTFETVTPPMSSEGGMLFMSGTDPTKAISSLYLAMNRSRRASMSSDEDPSLKMKPLNLNSQPTSESLPSVSLNNIALLKSAASQEAHARRDTEPLFVPHQGKPDTAAPSPARKVRKARAQRKSAAAVPVSVPASIPTSIPRSDPASIAGGRSEMAFPRIGAPPDRNAVPATRMDQWFQQRDILGSSGCATQQPLSILGSSQHQPLSILGSSQHQPLSILGSSQHQPLSILGSSQAPISNDQISMVLPLTSGTTSAPSSFGTSLMPQSAPASSSTLLMSAAPTAAGPTPGFVLGPTSGGMIAAAPQVSGGWYVPWGGGHQALSGVQVAWVPVQVAQPQPDSSAGSWIQPASFLSHQPPSNSTVAWVPAQPLSHQGQVPWITQRTPSVDSGSFQHQNKKQRTQEHEPAPNAAKSKRLPAARELLAKKHKDLGAHKLKPIHSPKMVHAKNFAAKNAMRRGSEEIIPITAEEVRNCVPVGTGRGEKLRNRTVRWTREEHMQFLRGLELYGVGKWCTVARVCMKTRTPIQIASHFQKFAARSSMSQSEKAKVSMLDETTERVQRILNGLEKPDFPGERDA